MSGGCSGIQAPSVPSPSGSRYSRRSTGSPTAWRIEVIRWVMESKEHNVKVGSSLENCMKHGSEKQDMKSNIEDKEQSVD
ncbi:hypothetical protein RJT34_17040 [Clitoria ternatea]|uniref:Uncharacterized protein n=1 Tax=Clitoria ternatea TaxID=43366 RepID=A0AAN9J8H8_CLITE